MQCRTCGYDLWNLPEPRCPECGSAFDLRTYRFAKNSVTFACPECDGHHPGFGEAYLPSEHDQIACAHCAKTIDVPRMRVVPLTAEPVPAIGEAMPWEDRDRGSRLLRWFQTVRLVMLSPVKAGLQIDPRNGRFQSVTFAVLTHLFGLSVNAVLLIGLIWVVALFSGSFKTITSSALITILGLAAVSIYALTVGVFVTYSLGLAAHLFLKVFEPNRKDLGITLRCTAYAQAPIALMAIPLCGYHIGATVGSVWMFVSLVGLLRGAHGTTLNRAIYAAIWLPLVLIVLYVTAVVVVITTPLGGLLNL